MTIFTAVGNAVKVLCNRRDRSDYDSSLNNSSSADCKSKYFYTKCIVSFNETVGGINFTLMYHFFFFVSTAKFS